MKCVMALLSLVLFLAGTNVMGQEVFSKDVTEYKFTDDLVKGDLVAPDGAITSVRRSGPGRSLIKLRSHFVMEMLKNAEDI